MKRVILPFALLTLFVQPVWGNQCPGLIREGRDLLASAKLTKANETKVKALLDEAQKLHDNGSHSASVNRANEALELLKKK